MEETAESTIDLVQNILKLRLQFESIIRPLLGKSYRNALLDNLFSHPYTKISFIEEILQVSRITATQYLDKIAEQKLLRKVKLGRSNYYINIPLYELFLTISNLKE